MRFRFAGGVDVPEWLLAEVSLLSAVSCVRLKLLCRAVCLDLSGSAPLDLAKAATLLSKGREGGACAAAAAAATAVRAAALRTRWLRWQSPTRTLPPLYRRPQPSR